MLLSRCFSLSDKAMNNSNQCWPTGGVFRIALLLALWSLALTADAGQISNVVQPNAVVWSTSMAPTSYWGCDVLDVNTHVIVMSCLSPAPTKYSVSYYVCVVVETATGNTLWQNESSIASARLVTLAGPSDRSVLVIQHTSGMCVGLVPETGVHLWSTLCSNQALNVDEGGLTVVVPPAGESSSESASYVVTSRSGLGDVQVINAETGSSVFFQGQLLVCSNTPSYVVQRIFTLSSPTVCSVSLSGDPSLAWCSNVTDSMNYPICVDDKETDMVYFAKATACAISAHSLTDGSLMWEACPHLGDVTAVSLVKTPNYIMVPFSASQSQFSGVYAIRKQDGVTTPLYNIRGADFSTGNVSISFFEGLGVLDAVVPSVELLPSLYPNGTVYGSEEASDTRLGAFTFVCEGSRDSKIISVDFENSNNGYGQTFVLRYIDGNAVPVAVAALTDDMARVYCLTNSDGTVDAAIISTYDYNMTKYSFPLLTSTMVNTTAPPFFPHEFMWSWIVAVPVVCLTIIFVIWRKVGGDGAAFVASNFLVSYIVLASIALAYYPTKSDLFDSLPIGTTKMPHWCSLESVSGLTATYSCVGTTCDYNYIVTNGSNSAVAHASLTWRGGSSQFNDYTEVGHCYADADSATQGGFILFIVVIVVEFVRECLVWWNTEWDRRCVCVPIMFWLMLVFRPGKTMSIVAETPDSSRTTTIHFFFAAAESVALFLAALFSQQSIGGDLSTINSVAMAFSASGLLMLAYVVLALFLWFCSVIFFTLVDDCKLSNDQSLGIASYKPLPLRAWDATTPIRRALSLYSTCPRFVWILLVFFNVADIMRDEGMWALPTVNTSDVVSCGPAVTSLTGVSVTCNVTNISPSWYDDPSCGSILDHASFLSEPQLTIISAAEIQCYCALQTPFVVARIVSIVTMCTEPLRQLLALAVACYSTHVSWIPLVPGLRLFYESVFFLAYLAIRPGLIKGFLFSSLSYEEAKESYWVQFLIMLLIEIPHAYASTAATVMSSKVLNTLISVVGIIVLLGRFVKLYIEQLIEDTKGDASDAPMFSSN